MYAKSSARKEGLPTWCPYNLGSGWCERKSSRRSPHTDILLTPTLQLFCQNLSLFGKLFIDVKTLFFDCDNCEATLTYVLFLALTLRTSVLFYLLTDAVASRDHFIGFFSKVRPSRSRNARVDRCPRKSFRMTTTTWLASWCCRRIKGKVTACS